MGEILPAATRFNHERKFAADFAVTFLKGLYSFQVLGATSAKELWLGPLAMPCPPIRMRCVRVPYLLGEPFFGVTGGAAFGATGSGSGSAVSPANIAPSSVIPTKAT